MSSRFSRRTAPDQYNPVAFDAVITTGPGSVLQSGDAGVGVLERQVLT